MVSFELKVILDVAKNYVAPLKTLLAAMLPTEKSDTRFSTVPVDLNYHKNYCS